MSRPFRLIRKYAKFILWTIAVLIIPSFILWGVGSALQSQNQARVAGRIFNRNVPRSEFRQAYQTTLALLFLSGMEEYIPFIDPVEFTWDRLILLHEAKRREIRVPDEEVAAYIRKIPAFVDENGFTQKRYEEILRLRLQTTPRSFEEEIRSTLAIAKLRDQVMGEAQLDEEALWKEYRVQEDKRRIAWAEFKEEEVEKARALLQEIQAKMKNDAISFEEAAKALRLSTKESAPIRRSDPLEGIGLAPELTRAAFALSIGEVGGVVKTPNGFAILQPKEEIPAAREVFEKEKEPFRQVILQQKRLQHYNEWFEVLKAKAQLVSNLETPEEPPQEP